MKVRWTYAAILSLSVAGAGMLGPTVMGEEPSPNGTEGIRTGTEAVQDTGNAAIKGAADVTRSDVNTSVDPKTASDIKARLASIINNSVSKNGFDDLVGSLVKTDRDRLGQDRFKDFSKLNDKIDEFRKAFRDKYGQEFDFKSAYLDNHLTINRGADKDDATVLLSNLTSGLGRTDVRSGTDMRTDTGTPTDNRMENDKRPDRDTKVDIDRPQGHVNADMSPPDVKARADLDRGNAAIRSDNTVAKTDTTVRTDTHVRGDMNPDMSYKQGDYRSLTGNSGPTPGNTMDNTPGAQPSYDRPAVVSDDHRIVGYPGRDVRIIGNPRGMDKSPTKVLVDAVLPNGTIVHNKVVDASRVHNPDVELRAGTANSWYMPQVVAVDRSDDAHAHILAQHGDQYAQPSALTGTDQTTTEVRKDTTVRTDHGAMDRGTVRHDAVRHDMTTTGDLGMGLANQLMLHNEGAVGNGWRLDIPDGQSAQSLSDSLIRHIQMTLDSKANWPADVKDAHRLVARHVFDALFDTRGTKISSER